MRSNAPAPGSVGALMIAVGLGVALWFGWDWYHLPKWTEQDIRASVELNLALDLGRTPEQVVGEAEQQRMRASIQREVEAEIAREAEEPRGFTFAGLAIAAFGLVQMLIRRRMASRS